VIGVGVDTIVGVGVDIDTSPPSQANPNIIIMLSDNVKTILALFIVCLQPFVVESILWGALPVNISTNHGMIGSAVAKRLRERAARICIYDKDPIRILCAHLDGYSIGPRNELLARANVVIGATGPICVSYLPSNPVMKWSIEVANANRLRALTKITNLSTMSCIRCRG